jgi:hypothetical protein
MAIFLQAKPLCVENRFASAVGGSGARRIGGNAWLKNGNHPERIRACVPLAPGFVKEKGRPAETS